MNIKKIISVLAGALISAANITPILAGEVSTFNMDTNISICEDQIHNSGSLIQEYIDGIQIEKETPVVNNEVSYTYIEQPIYNYEVETVSNTVMSVDEFMTLYGSMIEDTSQEETITLTDTSSQQEAYNVALANYNAALAEYEAASQLVEANKEVEVEVSEEVIDEEGNASQVTRTEIQTITEMVPSGDVEAAQANLDAAKMELDNALMALDASSTIVEQTTVTEPVTYADSGTCGENLTWTLDGNKQLTISGTGEMDDYIDYDTYSPWGTDVVKVVIENGVTSIGNNAFKNCSNLVDVVIPDTVSSIGDGSFSYCTSLTDVVIPKGVPCIGHSLFEGCSNLTKVTIPESVHSIGTSAFFGCSNLVNLVIPDKVDYIGRGAFSECTSIQSIFIPNGVTRIEPNTFYGCEALASVFIHDNVTYIGEYAFQNCYNLRSVNNPVNVEYIGPGAFMDTAFYNEYEGDYVIMGKGFLYKYKGATRKLTIPDTVIHIGSYVCEYPALINDAITMTDSVKYIHDYAFDGYTATSLTLSNKLVSIGKYAFSEIYVKEIVLPDTVTELGEGAFYGSKRLTKVTLPQGLTTIQPRTFYECTALESVIIPSRVKEIKGFAFYGCKKLQSLDMPSNLISIGDQAFSGCSLLKYIYIPNTVTEIGSDAFKYTPFIESHTEEFVVLGNGILYQYNGTDTEVVIPDTVSRIGSYIFSSDITRVTIPNSVVCIGDYAFSNDEQLTSIDIPDSVTSIGDWAFNSCYSLRELSIPKSVNHIGINAFQNTAFMYYYPDDFMVLGNGILYKYVGHDKEIVIPNTVKTINRSAFSDSRDITGVVIPDSVTSIQEIAFEYCSVLKTVVLSKNVKNIDQMAFYYCSNLKAIELPESLSEIGEDVFKECIRLDDVYYQGTKKTWDEKQLYEFYPHVTIHFGKTMPFTDVPEDAWYYDVARECYETGLINGTSATTFSPMQTMTRAMVVTILWRMDGQPKTEFNNKFKDVSSKQWYATSISWAVNNGVVNGYGDGTFKPDAAVTREQVAVMLANYAGYKKVYKPGTKKLNTYPDGSQVSTWAQQGMKWALTNGIISGDGAGYLHPKKSATRAEGAAMLLRMNNWL